MSIDLLTYGGECCHDLPAAVVMRRPVVSIQRTATFWQAWEAMARAGVRHLAVLDGESCLGVVDDRSILRGCLAGTLTPNEGRVADECAGPVPAVLAQQRLPEIARAMLDRGQDAVVVVDDHGRLTGVITATDLAAVLSHREAAQEPAVART